MRLYVTVPLALLLATACASTDSVSAEDALLQSAIAGEEESLSRDNFAMNEDAPQPLFRECDAQRDYDKLFEEMDANASGSLEEGERDDVQAHHPPPFAPGPWQMIAFVYDTDQSGDLDEAERAVILEDFSARCESLHDKLLAEFDADGSGDLDDTELAAAKQALDERRPDGPPPEGPPPDSGDTSRPEGPPMGPPPEGEIPPPFLSFDTNGDGTLSETEFAVLQADVRAHIRNGDPPPPPPGAPEHP